MIEVVDESINRIKPMNGLESQGWGYVFLPPNIKPDVYKKHCKNTYTVCMAGENGLFYTAGVKVPKNLINEIEFPNSTSEKGSLVWYNINGKNSFPVIINVYSKSGESNSVTNEKAFIYSTADIDCGISIDNEGNICLFSDGGKDLEISNTNGGDLNLGSSTSINLASFDAINSTSETLNITSELEDLFVKLNIDPKSFKVEDSNGNKIELNTLINIISSGIIKIKSDSFVYLNNATSPAVKGTELASLLSQILGLIGKLTALDGALATALLPPSANAYVSLAGEITAVGGQISQVLSQTVFLS